MTPKINNCPKCYGSGWLYWHELDRAGKHAGKHPEVKHEDDTHYTCDRCQGKPDVKLSYEAFDPRI